MISLSIGIGLTRTIGQAGPTNPITGTGPTLAALTDGDTLSSAVTWGSYLPGGATADRQMRVDGGAWVAYVGGTVVTEAEVWQVREVVSYSGFTSTFVSAVQTVAEAPTAPIVTGEDYDPDTDTLTFTVDEPVTLYALHNASATPLSAATIKAGAEITQALAAGIGYVDWVDDLWGAGTWYLHVMVEDADGLSTVLTPIQHVKPIPGFAEDWSLYSVGNAFADLEAEYTRNPNTISVAIAADASGPDGKRCEIIGVTSNERFISRDDITTALSFRTTERIQFRALLRMASLANARSFVGWAVDTTNVHTGIHITRNASTWTIACQLEGNPNTPGSNSTNMLSGVADNALVRIVCEIDGLDIKGKAYLDGNPEPGSWTVRTAASAISFPQLGLGVRVSGNGLWVLGYTLAIGMDAAEV